VQTEGIIRDYIDSELLSAQGRVAEQFTAETSLYRSGIVDSFGLMSLVQFLETRFGISVLDEEMVPENFENLVAISRFVDSKRGGQSSRTT
jgi:acyl carrier protein